MQFPKLKMLVKQLGQLLIGLDQLLNSLISLIGIPLGMNVAMADESLSARAYRNEALYQKRRWIMLRAVIDTILFLRPDHCMRAFDAEIDRRQVPEDYRLRPYAYKCPEED